ncbi:MAG: hydroxymethylglutaryl-CoA lyase [Rhodocyclaceae bacterium]
MTNLPRRVRIFEAGARDGLQNEPKAVPAAVKLELIRRLAGTGLKAVEATAFVSPKWVPQMADQDAVLRGTRSIGEAHPGVDFPVLVPNMKGFEAALAAGAREIGVFAAASEHFSRNNINCSIAESLERFRPVVAAALENGVKVRGYVSCALGCPFEGEVSPQQVAAVAVELDAMGCYEICLGDTIGVGTPGKTKLMIEAVARRIAVERLAGHYHDTYGMAIANIYASLEMGLAAFDSSVAGLGGCPYAPGASGNVATEDVVYLLNGLGIEAGVDMERLVAAGTYICEFLGRAPASKVARALSAKCSAPHAEV